jgi:hypothetical protein
MASTDPAEAFVSAEPSSAQQAAIDRRLRPSLERCLNDARSTLAAEHCNLAEIDWQQGVLVTNIRKLEVVLATGAKRDAFEVEQAKWSEDVDRLCRTFTARHGTVWAIRGQRCNLNQTVLRRLAIESRLDHRLSVNQPR